MQEPIFVFGSNLAGIHGAGAALWAKNNRGARPGSGLGRTGQAYAIPTKDAQIRTLPLAEIAKHVADFLIYAAARPHQNFQVTPIGTGLAGYKHEDIAPMFRGAPPNCLMPREWWSILNNEHKPLPVAGYVPQSQENVDLVNEGKLIEEQVLRYLDKVGHVVQSAGSYDPRFLAIGRTDIQKGFMCVFRSVFNPKRASLPGDA